MHVRRWIGAVTVAMSAGCGLFAGLNDLVFEEPAAGGSHGVGGGGGVGGDGGSAGDGGEPMGPCGTIAALHDDFSDGLPGGPAWSFVQDSGTTVSETGGVLSIALPALTDVAEALYASHYRYDMRDGEVAVEVPSMVDTSKDALVYLRVVVDDLNRLGFEQRSGQLRFIARVNSADLEPSPSVAYDPIAHRWWRIRDHQRTVTWETSPDGARWDVAATVATDSLATLEYVSVTMGAEAYGNYPDPGTVEFDNLNTSVTPAPLCAAASLRDEFEDGVIGAEWGRSHGHTVVGVSETDGELALALAPSTLLGLWWQRSARAFDFTASTVTVALTAAPAASDVEAFMGVESLDPYDVGSVVQFVVTNGKLILRSMVGLDEIDATSITFSPVDHAWLRLAEDQGVVRGLVSGDGRAWSEIGQTHVVFAPEMVAVYFGGGTWVGVADPGELRFAHWNGP